MGDAADDLMHQELSESLPYSEWNPRGYKVTKKAKWKTRDGKTILIEDMQTSHIINCIRMLQRVIDSRPDPYAWGEPESDAAQDAFNSEIRANDDREETLKEQIKVFNKELVRRGEQNG